MALPLKKIICIYKITAPNNKVYIGQTIDYARRMREYKAGRCTGQKQLFKSLITYGAINHTFEVLHQCEQTELDLLERKYIKQFASYTKGLNGNRGPKTKAKCKTKKKRPTKTSS